MKLKKITKPVIISLLTLATLGISTNVKAANNMAFSAGEGYSDIDSIPATLSCYSSYASMGYNSYYSTTGATKDVLAGSFSNGTKRLESDIVFLTGHGDYNYIQPTIRGRLEIGSYKDSQTRIGTEDVNWEKVKLAIFLGCETGEQTNNNPENITYDVFEKSNWKTTTMGWRQIIGDKDGNAWIDYFNSKLETGSTISAALNYANSKNIYERNSIKDLSFFGDPNLVLKKTRSVVTNDLDEDNIKYITEDISFDGTNIETINKLLKDEFSDFKLEDYEIDIFTNSEELGFYTIDYTYKINDIYTNSGYTVIVNNRKVVQIADNSIPIDEKKLDINFENYAQKEDIAKEIGKSYTNKFNNENCINNYASIVPISIKEQETRKYIDLKNNKKYIQVSTIYSYKDESATAVNCYKYEI